MERDYGNKTADIEAHDAEGERDIPKYGESAGLIPREKARELLTGILKERAEVFRKLAR